MSVQSRKQRVAPPGSPLKLPLLSLCEIELLELERTKSASTSRESKLSSPHFAETLSKLRLERASTSESPTRRIRCPASLTGKMPLVQSTSSSVSQKFSARVHRNRQAELDGYFAHRRTQAVEKELQSATDAHDVERLRLSLERARAADPRVEESSITRAKDRLKQLTETKSVVELLRIAGERIKKLQQCVLPLPCARVQLKIAPVLAQTECPNRDPSGLQDAVGKVLMGAYQVDESAFHITSDALEGSQGTSLEITVEIKGTASMIGVARYLEIASKDGKFQEHLAAAGAPPQANVQVVRAWSLLRLKAEMELRFSSLQGKMDDQVAEDMIGEVARSCRSYDEIWEAIVVRYPRATARLCQQKSSILVRGKLTPEHEAFRNAGTVDSLEQEPDGLEDILADAAIAQLQLKCKLAPGTTWCVSDFNDPARMPIDDKRRMWHSSPLHSLPDAVFVDPGIKCRYDIIEEAEARRKPGMTCAPYHELVDVSRLDIIFQSVDDLLKALAWCLDHLDLAWLRNQFSNPACTGYRDVTMGVQSYVYGRMHISELRLHLKPLYDFKQGPGNEFKERVKHSLQYAGMRPHEMIIAQSLLLLVSAQTQWRELQQAQANIRFASKLLKSSYSRDAVVSSLALELAQVSASVARQSGVSEAQVQACLDEVQEELKDAEQRKQKALALEGAISQDDIATLEHTLLEAREHCVEKRLLELAEEQLGVLRKAETAQRALEAAMSDGDARKLDQALTEAQNHRISKTLLEEAEKRLEGVKCVLEEIRKARDACRRKAAENGEDPVPAAVGNSPSGWKEAATLLQELQELSFIPSCINKLKDAGFSLQELLDGGFLAPDLRRNGFTLTDFSLAGFDTRSLKTAGFPVHSLLKHGSTIRCLKEADVTIEELKGEGVSVQRLLDAGFDAKEIKEQDYTIDQFVNAGFSIEKLMDTGFSHQELKEAGFDLRQLKSADVSLEDLKLVGFVAAEFLEAGLSAEIVQKRLFSAGDFTQAGFTPQVLAEKNGFSVQDLRDVGYSDEDLRQAGIGLDEQAEVAE